MPNWMTGLIFIAIILLGTLAVRGIIWTVSPDNAIWGVVLAICLYALSQCDREQ